MSNAELVEDVTKTITQLQRHGWVQLHFFTPDGRCCLAGAANRAVTDGNRLSNLLDLLRAEIKSDKLATRLRTISEWNDAKGRTFADVIGLLKRARNRALSRTSA